MFFSQSDKDMFLDRDRVINKLAKGKHKALFKAGATCRKKIQQGMTRAKSAKPSRPGTPPRQRMAGDDGLRKITYNFVPEKDTIVLKVIRWRDRKYSPYNQPALHEFGGMAGRIQQRLTPKNDTRWMFEPKATSKYIGLQKSIKAWERYSKNRPLRIGKSGKKVKTLDDFNLVYESRQAAYPRRSFMQTGLQKYRQTKHFQKIMQDLLKG